MSVSNVRNQRLALGQEARDETNILGSQTSADAWFVGPAHAILDPRTPRGKRLCKQCTTWVNRLGSPLPYMNRNDTQSARKTQLRQLSTTMLNRLLSKFVPRLFARDIFRNIANVISHFASAYCFTGFRTGCKNTCETYSVFRSEIALSIPGPFERLKFVDFLCLFTSHRMEFNLISKTSAATCNSVHVTKPKSSLKIVFFLIPKACCISALFDRLTSYLSSLCVCVCVSVCACVYVCVFEFIC